LTLTQLEKASESMPAIALYHLSLLIVDAKEVSEVRLLLSRLQAFYARRITSTAHLLPNYRPGDSPILTIKSGAVGAVMIQLPSKNGDSPTDQETFEVPQSLGAECSGSLRAVIKGDKVDVVMKFKDESALF
jgi:hypothetical protein